MCVCVCVGSEGGDEGGRERERHMRAAQWARSAADKDLMRSAFCLLHATQGADNTGPYQRIRAAGRLTAAPPHHLGQPAAAARSQPAVWSDLATCCTSHFFLRSMTRHS